MSKTDLVLLHAPHVYDYRKLPQLYGPVSDLVLSTPIYEMYPIGFSSMAEYLGRFGFHVRLVNLAFRMLKNPDFDVVAFIKKLHAPVFGIDLHWLVHAHGSVEIAKLVKSIHPQAKTLFGGFSSSYFYKELIAYSEVDYVMRGDSTEEPMRIFLEELKTGRLEKVHNLVWKDAQGTVHDNGLSFVPDNISDVMQNHYTAVARSVLRYFDLSSTLPAKEWLKYPVTAVLTCKGCDHNCVYCGGANAAVRKTVSRYKTALRSAADMFRDIQSISRLSRGPIFILGDIRMGGEERAYELLRMLKQKPVKNTIDFELFSPPDKPFLEAIAQAKPGFAIDISPQSHDIKVRRAIGLSYSNADLENSIEHALKLGASRLEIYFMVGLPEQTPETVSQTLDYCEELYKHFHADKRLFLFIGPLSPFLDPGSLAFENPARYGYRVIHRSLAEHRNALTRPSWKETLNYETRWMNREQIVETTYSAIARLTRIKQRYNQITTQMADAQLERIANALEMEKRIDEIVRSGDESKLFELKPTLDRLNGMDVVERKQLKLPVGAVKLRYLRSLLEIIRGRQQ
ncbi:MAG: TIGR04190 family B12-binding domain/radical SAM domain protein [Dehalococcoidia bacterium]|nr:TIGR04190 family B12-binding domain/radical SAM domain protein [Dehalococcoidia bacterium]